MSASPSPSAVPSTKRPLDEESSSSGPTDQPDAKRPALDKMVRAEEPVVEAKPAQATAEVEPSAEPVKEAAEPTTLSNGHQAEQEDTLVPDAPGGSSSAGAAVLETQPIQSMANNQSDRVSSHGAQSYQGHQDETGWIHVRAVISSAEAATVIGKGGENVSLIRRHSGAKCTVSDYTRGAVERILTVSGLVDATAKVKLNVIQAVG